MSAPEAETDAGPLNEGPGPARTASRPALVSGIVGGLVGAVCCIGPAVGVALGASAGSFLIGLSRYRPVTFALGAALAAGALLVQLRRRRAACGTDREFSLLRSRWLDVALVAFALTYVIGRFVVPRIIERF